ncbi:MAG: serine/threonine protein kinase [Labilithrix sp.]|nr:serine/threonine protein kinase [Labilithrix sp.]
MASRPSRYETLARIASGGMATVYVGRLRGAVGFSRLVAIKRPHPFVTEDAHLVEQLQAEARVASMIHHPNVVSVLDVEEIDGEVMLVMDYVEGCTLKTLLDREDPGSTPFHRVAVRVVLDVAAGLHAAHRLRDARGALLGVVHRDVSPQNVLVGTDGVARLADFGIAKIASSEENPTATDIMKGKMSYLAPEYVARREFDARGDLFALAVVAWEALTGQRLFKAATTVETLSNILNARPPLLSATSPELVGLDAVIAKALSREPSDRPPSVEALATELEARARALDLVATHAEVGAMVERVAGAALASRRQALEGGASAPVELGARGLPPLTERDHAETASLTAGSPDGAGPAATVTEPVTSVSHEAPPPRRPRRWRAGVSLAMGAVVVAGAGVFLLHFAQGRRPPSSASMAVDASPPSPSAGSFAGLAADESRPSAAPPGALPAVTAEPSARAPRPRRALPTRPAPPTSTSLLPQHAPPNPYPH